MTRIPAAATEAVKADAAAVSVVSTLHDLGFAEHCWERFGESPGP